MKAPPASAAQGRDCSCSRSWPQNQVLRCQRRTSYGILTNNSVYKLIVGVYQNIVIIIIYIHEYTMGSLYKPLTLLLHGAGIDTKICPKITQFCRFLYTSTMEHMGHLHTFTSFTVFRGTKID